MHPVDIERLIKERDEARESKDYSRADAIREKLLSSGIVVEDGVIRHGAKITDWRVI